MNASKIAISLTLAAAVTSMAAPNENAKPRVIVSPPRVQEVNSGEGYMGYTNFVSTKTRAEVIAELGEAQRRGEIVSGEAYPGPLTAPTSKTRAEVVAELKAYRAPHPDQSDDGAFT